MCREPVPSLRRLECPKNAEEDICQFSSRCD
jgi:hypothetical protein